MAVKSSRAVFLVLHRLAREPEPLTARHIAETLALPSTTAARALATLEAAGYAERRGHGWRIGPAARTLAFAFMAQFPLRDLASRPLQRLAHETGTTASLFIRLGPCAVRIASAPGRNLVAPAAPLGEARALTEGAAALVLLDAPPPEAAAELARTGALAAPSPSVPGACDLAFPLRDAAGRAVASLVAEALPDAQVHAALAPARAIATDLASLAADAPSPYDHIPSDAIAL